MPEQTTETTQAVTAPAQETVAPQQESREAVYQRLYGEQQAAQVAQTVQTQQATPPPDYQALISALAQEVANLKASHAPAPVVQVPQEDWFALLQAGKRTEAEQALINRVQQGAAAQITQETLMQALELSRTEREIEDYNSYIKSQNPDMLDVEDLVSLKAEKKFLAVQASVKSTKDYIDTYKRVVNESVNEIRQLLQRTRAAAKNEAMTTRREVLSSTTMSPNDIGRREQTDGNQQPPAEPDNSPQSYMEMRKANAQKRANPYDAANRNVVGL